MIVALLSILSFAQAVGPAGWRELPGDSDAAYAYRLLEDDTGGDVRRVVLRATPAEAREWATGELVYELSCGAGTFAILSARSLDASGAELQAVTVPEDRRMAGPIYADNLVVAAIFAELCPHGGSLPERPAAPPLIATAPHD